jgi:hypothetical protein
MQKKRARELAMYAMEVADRAAVRRHGELKGGMARWAHHLEEECVEAMAEMRRLQINRHHWDTQLYDGIKADLAVELAQVAQLAIKMMEMLYQKKEWEEEETWKTQQQAEQAEQA